MSQHRGHWLTAVPDLQDIDIDVAIRRAQKRLDHGDLILSRAPPISIFGTQPDTRALRARHYHLEALACVAWMYRDQPDIEPLMVEIYQRLYAKHRAKHIFAD